MVGEGGGEIDFLGGNRTCITYVCKKEKKREFPSGLEPQKCSNALKEVERVAYYAIGTYMYVCER